MVVTIKALFPQDIMIIVAQKLLLEWHKILQAESINLMISNHLDSMQIRSNLNTWFAVSL